MCAGRKRERVSRYHEGTNSVRGRKNGRGDKERKENVEPTLGLLHSFISPDLRHQVVELGPQILRKKNGQERRRCLKLATEYLILCVDTQVSTCL